jgi:hypothetical protein
MKKLKTKLSMKTMKNTLKSNSIHVINCTVWSLTLIVQVTTCCIRDMEVFEARLKLT